MSDLRTGGAWTLTQRVKNDLWWALARAALGATRPLPLRTLGALGRALGLTAHAFATAARRQALANAARIFPDRTDAERRALVRRCFARLGEAMGETAALLRADGRPAPLPVDADARALLSARPSLQTTRRGAGVLFASAHLGPWEHVAASLAAAGVPLVTIARESYDPRFSQLFDAMRRRAGVGVVWRGRRGAVSAIVRALRGGGVLGVPMDLRSRVASRDVPFLGHAAPTAIGPARLALKTGARVVVGSAAPLAGGGLGVTATAIASADLSDDDDGALELTGRINAELSRRILALPEAWVWMHDRWTTTPDS